MPISRTRQGISAISSGVLLTLSGAHGSFENIKNLLIEATEEGIIPIEIARAIGGIFFYITLFSGVIVVAGGIIHLSGKYPSVANFLIGFGSGASIFDLILFMALSGPVLKIAIIEANLGKISNLGIQYVLLTLATVFAYIALISDLVGFTLSFVSAFLINLAGSFMELILILNLLEKMGMHRPPKILVDLIVILFLSGVLLFIGGILYGYEKYRIGLILNLIGLLSFIMPYISIIIGYLRYQRLLIRPILGTLGLITGGISVIYGFLKLRPKEKE